VSDDLYAFVFRAQLAQEAVNRALNLHAEDPKDSIERITQKMPLDLFEKELVKSSSKMASVYMAIAAFENSVRKFIQDRLLEEIGPGWWTTNVSQEIRNGAEQRKKDEEQTRWHGARGTSMIFYTQMGDLVSIMQQNTILFESHIESIEWARQIVKTLERSRNVIMHSGELSMADVERVSMNIRDWLRQVGG
jgi:hypothetical protein